MPDSCAKAFLPTIALLGCTGNPVIPDTNLDAFIIFVESIFVLQSKISRLVLTVITISSSAALPARSPRPFIVHSICLAPFNTAEREFATAKPRSL